MSDMFSNLHVDVQWLRFVCACNKKSLMCCKNRNGMKSGFLPSFIFAFAAPPLQLFVQHKFYEK
eukprot:TRINITY_DN7275_c0_g1_i1.p3 TRINITY_DN7275_c0_g1~~TRINITY_DN7275_c0_g1_i1.p3  ORF type:complete len:64 (+),score=10.95 TRINITY_DN7275_c0_g1_i1:222-413(+)